MEPEGRLEGTTSCDLVAIEKGDSVSEGKPILTGKAIFSYKKPIFTAIVIPDNEPGACKSSDSPVEATDVDEENNGNVMSDEQIVNSLYKFSLYLGFVIGCFIQSSSLGANYILTVLYGHEYDMVEEHRQEVIVISLAWSFMTSLMGIMILVFLRRLITMVVRAEQGPYGVASKKQHRGNSSPLDESLLAQIEHAFAFGALAGVCAAWAGTDVALGLRAHAYHSILTLAFAIVGKMFLGMFKKSDAVAEEAQDEKLKALLDNDDDSVESQILMVFVTEEASRYIHSHFKYKGILIGFIVGFFIQFSSLGASFLIDAAYGIEIGEESEPNALVYFSLGWSFLFGSMGVITLLLLRAVLSVIWERVVTEESSDLDDDDLWGWTDRWTLNFEFFFAAGCLMGVNVAWVVTDLGLGLEAHMIRSVVTLLAAAVWCKGLSYCFFGRKHRALVCDAGSRSNNTGSD